LSRSDRVGAVTGHSMPVVSNLFASKRHLALALFGTSLAGFRLFAAVAFAAAMILTALMAREFGASRGTQLFVAAVAAFAPIALMGSSLFQYVAFDYLGWVAIGYCTVRLLNSQDARWWLAMGAAGLGQILQKSLRHLENDLDLLVGEIVDRDDVARQRPGFRHQSAAIGPIGGLGQARSAAIGQRCTVNFEAL